MRRVAVLSRSDTRRRAAAARPLLRVVSALSTSVDVAARDSRDGVLQRRKMRAAEHQGVRLRFASNSVRDSGATTSVDDLALDQSFFRQRTRTAGTAGWITSTSGAARVDGADISAAVHRAFGGDDGDGTVEALPRARLPRPARSRRSTGTGANASSSAGNATPDAVLHATTSIFTLPLHERACRLHRIARDGVAALGAVGQPRGVAEIDETLARQPRHQRAHHGQSAHAGIENADRPRRSSGGLAK